MRRSSPAGDRPAGKPGVVGDEAAVGGPGPGERCRRDAAVEPGLDRRRRPAVADGLLEAGAVGAEDRGRRGHEGQQRRVGHDGAGDQAGTAPEQVEHDQRAEAVADTDRRGETKAVEQRGGVLRLLADRRRRVRLRRTARAIAAAVVGDRRRPIVELQLEGREGGTRRTRARGRGRPAARRRATRSGARPRRLPSSASSKASGTPPAALRLPRR